MWKGYKAGQETDAIPDGIATTLIRIGAAALVEEPVIVEDVKNDAKPVEIHDEDKQADSSDQTDSGAGDAGGSEAPAVLGGVRSKQRSRTGKQDSGSP
jgi:hypothetical protein